MIHKLSDYKIKALNHISPSQYHSAISCPYKLVLANSFGYQTLLPLNANAHFGSVIHKMIELISKGIINSERTFYENWDELIHKKEEELKVKGLESITPLKYFVNDFGLKKSKLKNVLKKKQEKLHHDSTTTSSNYYPEKRLENSEKSIIGIADLIIENNFGTTILEFKTGKIFSDTIDESGAIEQVIKKEYEVQLKLYAHLYYLMTGNYPISLFIVTLSKDFTRIEFQNSECEKIYFDALDFLSSTNFYITKDKLVSIANPSTDNCKYCSYRPACEFYLEWLTVNFSEVNDLFGLIKNVNQFGNNTLGLQLQMQDKQVLINGLPIDRKSDFESLIGKNVILYNLKKYNQSLNATANIFTIVYEHQTRL